MKKIIIFIISCLFLFGTQFISISITGLSPEAITMIGIFIGAIILWLFVDVGWPSLLVLCSILQLPRTSVPILISDSFGNNTIAFLIFSCILTYALSSTGLLRRIALWFTNTKFAQKSLWHFTAMYFISILIIGSFIAPTVLFVVFYALVKEIYIINNLKPGDEYARMLMCGTAIMTSISCAMTPIAHTFPLMALGSYETMFGASISWTKYMLIGIPSGIIVAALVFICFYLCFKNKVNNYNITVIREKTIISKQEIFSGVIFLCVVTMWIIPYFAKWTTTIPPMIGIIILCLFKVLDFNDAVKNGVPWTSIILCATTLTIGKYLTSADLGIIKYIGGIIIQNFSKMTTFVLILGLVMFTIVMTNLMSNIVTVTLAYNLLIPIIMTIGTMSPILGTIIIGISASMAYATPPAIAHIALAAGSDYCNSKTMLIYGGIASIISIIIVTFISFLMKGFI